MLDVNFIREHPDKVRENTKKRCKDHRIVDKFLKIDKEWREKKAQADELRRKRNQLTNEITKLTKEKKDTKKLIEEAKDIPKQIKELEESMNSLEEERTKLHMSIPNMLHESVPIGKDDAENVEIEKIGEPKVQKYEIYNHAELAEKIQGLDLDTAREVSGQGFYFLKGDLALLHSAVLSYAKDFMIEQGFEYVIPPFMIRKKVVEGVMSFEEMDNMMYKIEGEDLYLIGTSEHSMIGMFKNKILNKKDLPYTLTSYSPCFRKEKGAHGMEERGLYRVHQFEKQEMIVICEPEESYDWYEKMLNFTVEVFKNLNVPVRKLECCSGDLANLKAKSVDVEAWSPRQKKYFEVGSCSNLTDAQARRLGIKVQARGETYYAHTLNNTVIASPRALIAVMENNQQKNGSIKIPQVLSKYMRNKKVIGENK